MKKSYITILAVMLILSASAKSYRGPALIDSAIRNQTGLQENANFNISGSGSVGTTLYAGKSGTHGTLYLRRASDGAAAIKFSSEDLGEFRVNNASGNGFITFQNTSSEGMRLTNAGNLLIGTTTGSARLTVAGSANISGNELINGKIGIGSSVGSATNLYLNKDITGGTSGHGIYNNSTVQTDVTVATYGIRSAVSTAAASYTISNIYAFGASDGVLGAGSAVTYNYGYYATDLVKGSNRNAAFAGMVSAGTNKYNLYMNGTATNYLAGSLGIGTTIPDAKLTVNGTIHSKEVKVDLDVPGPDYVFQPDYKLPALAEVKDYINRNRHLPEIPSAKEMAKDGLNLGEMNTRLLKKIEELTLYLIEKDKQVNELQQRLELIENRLTDK